MKLKFNLFSIILIILTLSNLVAKDQEIRGVWATPWDMNTPEKIDNLVNDSFENNLNLIMAEIRYRGDALYEPNKFSDEFYNPEQKSYIIDDNFDPLEYLIERAQPLGIKVVAWTTIFVVTPHDKKRINQDYHIYYENNDWLTYHKNGQKIKINQFSGAFVDPGLPVVQDYTISILKDIAANYDIDGVQLDYIRYPGSEYGYNPQAVKLYELEESEKSFESWKEEQVSRFVKRTYAELKKLNEDLLITAAVFPNLNQARSSYSQNWLEWLREDYIDYIFFMSYNRNTDFVENQMACIDKNYRKKIVVGLRSWSKSEYPAQKIIDKINRVRAYDYPGFAFFHYGGLQTKRYFFPLKLLVMNERKEFVNKEAKSNFIYGFVQDKNHIGMSDVEVSLIGSNKSILTDNNGFYFIDNIKDEDFSIKLNKDIFVFFSETIAQADIPRKYDYKFSNETEKTKYIRLYGKTKTKANILNWETNLENPFYIYKKDLSEEKDFTLCKIIVDKRKKWEDRSIIPKKEYIYKIIKSDTLQSNHLLIKN